MVRCIYRSELSNHIIVLVTSFDKGRVVKDSVALRKGRRPLPLFAGPNNVILHFYLGKSSHVRVGASF